LWTAIFVSPLVVYWSTIGVLGLSFNVEAVCQPRGVFIVAVVGSHERQSIGFSLR